MSKLIIFFIVVSAFVITAIEGQTPAPITCKKYEVYLGQMKAPNCDTVCSELGKPCTRQYIMAPSGCYCIKGYARDSNNFCIPIRKCPPKDTAIEVQTPAPITCKKYEVYLGQGKAPNCDTVCSEMGKPCTVRYIMAPSGCYCIKGYARDSNRVCIPIRKCPPKVPVAACDGAQDTPAPMTCKKNEEYLKQGDAPNCDYTCQTLNEPCYTNHFVAPFGCYCVKGYAKDGNNICIPIAQCPPKIPSNA